jgi:hypothetical protein
MLLSSTPSTVSKTGERASQRLSLLTISEGAPVYSMLFPKAHHRRLSVIAQLGLVSYMDER